MNITERLLNSSQNNHGLQLEASSVKEIVGLMQSMAGRLDALTRILAIALNQVGGSLDIEAELFGDAENYAIDVNWDEPEKGALIHVTLTRPKVGVPTVQEDDEAASGDAVDLLPVQESEGGREDNPDTGDTDEEGVA